MGEAVAVAKSGLAIEWVAYAQFFCAMIETNLGELRAATDWWAGVVETCGLAEESGWLLPMALAGLSVSQHLLGQTEQALRAAFGLRASAFRLEGPLQWLRTIPVEATPALMAGGEEEVALELLREAVRGVRRVGIPLAENHLLGMIAAVEHLRGRPERAGRLFAAARYLGGAADLPIPFRTPASVALYRHYLPRVRETLGPDEARRARDEGRAMTLDEALAYALEGLG
jgi:hypothetical protein